MQLVAPDILADTCGLSVGLISAGIVLVLALWLFGWWCHRFWIVLITTVLAGVYGLYDVAIFRAQPLLAAVLLALVGGLLALALVRLLAFFAGGMVGLLAAAGATPQSRSTDLLLDNRPYESVPVSPVDDGTHQSGRNRFAGLFLSKSVKPLWQHGRCELGRSGDRVAQLDLRAARHPRFRLSVSGLVQFQGGKGRQKVQGFRLLGHPSRTRSQMGDRQERPQGGLRLPL